MYEYNIALRDDYSIAQRDVTDIYGSKALLFRLSGYFLEYLDTGNKVVYTLSSLLGIKILKIISHNKVSSKLIAFPIFCKDVYIKALQDRGYTVIIYDGRVLYPEIKEKIL